MAELIFYVWMAGNSSDVLALGRTDRTAYEEAKRRCGGREPNGYPTRVTLDQFPPGSNPLIGVAHRLRSADMFVPAASQESELEREDPPKRKRRRPKIREEVEEKKIEGEKSNGLLLPVGGA